MTVSPIPARRTEQVLARLLQGGVWSAAAVITAGLALSFTARIAPVGAHAVTPWPIVTAGLLLLILLPVARVMAMCVLFLRARDYRFGLVAASVLVIIGLGFVVGVVAPRHAPEHAAPNHRSRDLGD